MCSISLRLYNRDRRPEKCSGGQAEERGRAEDKGEGPHERRGTQAEEERLWISSFEEEERYS